jgi:hypothetical protein
MSETAQPVAPAATEVAAATAPVVSDAAPSSPAPAAAPAAEPAATPAPVAAEATPTEAAPEKPFEHTSVETLLEKPPETPAPVGEKAAPATETPPTTAVPPEPIKYEAWTFPEGVKTDEALLNNYNEILGEARVPQEQGQKLIDLYNKSMEQAVKAMAEDQHRVFAETRQTWQQQIKDDPGMGGPAFNTTVQRVARMRDLFVAPEDLPAFNDFLRTTGAGDHPAFWKFVNNVGLRFDEPSPVAAHTPPPDAGRNPGRGSFAGQMYTHPSSQRAFGR